MSCKSEPSSSASGQTGQPPTPAAERGTSAAPTAQPASAKAAPEHGSAPAAVGPRTLEKLPDGRVALGPFALKLPSDWSEVPSTSNMRAAQFRLPAPSGGEAEIIVYYFGESGAGSVDANINRWVSQFKQADGSAVARDAAKIEKTTLAGQEATLVSVSGRYVATPPGGGATVDKPNQSMLAAIVPSPSGPYYFRLLGDAAVVDAQAPRFREALASLTLR